MLTCFPSLITGIYKSFKYRDWAGLYEPIVNLLVTDLLVISLLFNPNKLVKLLLPMTTKLVVILIFLVALSKTTLFSFYGFGLVDEGGKPTQCPEDSGWGRTLS